VSYLVGASAWPGGPRGLLPRRSCFDKKSEGAKKGEKKKRRSRSGAKRRPSPSSSFNSFSYSIEREKKTDSVPPPPRLFLFPGVVVGLKRALRERRGIESFVLKIERESKDVRRRRRRIDATVALCDVERCCRRGSSIRPPFFFSPCPSQHANSLCFREPAASASFHLPERTRDGRRAPLGRRAWERLAWRRGLKKVESFSIAVSLNLSSSILSLGGQERGAVEAERRRRRLRENQTARKREKCERQKARETALLLTKRERKNGSRSSCFFCFLSFKPSSSTPTPRRQPSPPCSSSPAAPPSPPCRPRTAGPSRTS